MSSPPAPACADNLYLLALADALPRPAYSQLAALTCRLAAFALAMNPAVVSI
jgi:hypothetical protein